VKIESQGYLCGIAHRVGQPYFARVGGRWLKNSISSAGLLARLFRRLAIHQEGMRVNDFLDELSLN
jgi:hypothetical protein